MIRIVLKDSTQISPDDFAVIYRTVEIENEELEKVLLRGANVVGAELIPNPPTTPNSN